MGDSLPPTVEKKEKDQQGGTSDKKTDDTSANEKGQNVLLACSSSSENKKLVYATFEVTDTDPREGEADTVAGVNADGGFRVDFNCGKERGRESRSFETILALPDGPGRGAKVETVMLVTVCLTFSSLDECPKDVADAVR